MMRYLLAWFVIGFAAAATCHAGSVVAVEIRTPAGETLKRGTAVCIETAIDPQHGVILLTAAHVVAKDIRSKDGVMFYKYYSKTEAYSEVYIGGQWMRATGYRASKHGDLALLIVRTDVVVPKVPVSAVRAKVGDPVVLSGYVLGLDYHNYRARVLGIDYKSQLGPNLDSVRLTEESIIPGQSGGCLTNPCGELVGICSSHRSDSPWEGFYTNQVEIARFLAAVAADPDPTCEKLSPHKASPMPDRAKPRLGPDLDDAAPPPPREGPEPPSVPQEGSGEVNPIPTLPDAPLPSRITPSPLVPIITEPAKETPPSLLPAPVGGNLGPVPQPVPAAPAKVPPQTRAGPVVLKKAEDAFIRMGPIVVTGLTWAGVLTGGSTTLAAVGVSALIWAINRRRGVPSPTPTPIPPQPQPQPCPQTGGAAGNTFPFPRKLDEARQLLELGKTEGRIPLCDALRGMFLDDEIEKLSADGNPATVELLRRLTHAIQNRVDEAAPLSVKG